MKRIYWVVFCFDRLNFIFLVEWIGWWCAEVWCLGFYLGIIIKKLWVLRYIFKIYGQNLDTKIPQKSSINLHQTFPRQIGWAIQKGVNFISEEMTRKWLNKNWCRLTSCAEFKWNLYTFLGRTNVGFMSSQIRNLCPVVKFELNGL